jgi:tetratricopeptide (TPR) repeat protein
LISYSHDSKAHGERVLALADRLRGDGVDAMIDLYDSNPPQGWPGWCADQIARADFVLMVCTETYRRRVDGNEEPGVGHGVLWEGRLIYQHLYGAGSVSSKFVPVLFADGSAAHVPVPIAGASIHRVETPDGYEALLRLLTAQPLTPMPPLGAVPQLPPRPRQPLEPAPSGAAPANSPQPGESLPHPRVEDLFVGRSAEREALAAGLFPASGTRRPVVVSGMAGAGKSYLVDRFFWERAAQFPGGYLRLAFDPDKPVTAADLLSTLRDRLKLPVGDDEALVARLMTPLTLVHLENADTIETGQVAGDLSASLPGCALVISARLRGLGAEAGWREVVVAPFDGATAVEQLRAELGSAVQGQESWPALAEALGCLPLALHLAAGHLRADRRAEVFLRRLRAKKLSLTGTDPADPTFRQRSRALLSDTFELSLDALHREGGTEGGRWLTAFAALGHAPTTGFGESLGAAIASVSPEVFDDFTLAAARLSLLERVARQQTSAFRMHPLVGELVRPRADREAALARMTEWFVARLPEGAEDQGSRWQEIGEEILAMTEWLALVPSTDRVRVERAGSRYAIGNGPYHSWLRFCEEALAGESSSEHRSNFLWTLGRTALSGGLPDRALAAAEEKATLDADRGADREAVLAAGLRADILQARGQLDEALKIHQEDVLPVFERLGDVRERAVTMGKIADILQDRGQLDEALEIRQEDELPVYERLGEVRLRAVTMGKIADILQARGQLDEALKIRQDDELPVYERLGDVRSRAVTMCKIADILQDRGQLDEALKILREEVLPATERLGDGRLRALTMGRIADILQARGQLDEALKIRQDDELPVFERLGDVRLMLVGRANLAMTLLTRGAESDREEARRLLHLALDAARRLKLPEAAQIEQILEQAGLGDDKIASGAPSPRL